MKALLFPLAIMFTCASFAQNDYKALFGDSIQEIQWSCDIIYLPGGQSHSISLKATPLRIRATYSETVFRRYWKRNKKRNVRISKKEFVRMQLRYKELTQNSFNMVLTEALKDSLRLHVNDTNYRGKRCYKITPELLETYLKNDSLEIDYEVFKQDTLTFMHGLSVIDGAPFSFYIRSISNQNDTTTFSYDGNLAGSDSFIDYGKFLIIRTLNEETSFYKKFPLDYYFKDETYYRVLLTYLGGKEGLLEFIPLRLLLEQIELEDN